MHPARLRLFPLFLFLAGFLGLSANCTSNSRPEPPQPENSLAGGEQMEAPIPVKAETETPIPAPAAAKVQRKLQEAILEAMGGQSEQAGQDTAQLFALVSQSGMSDRGQAWIIYKPGKAVVGSLPAPGSMKVFGLPANSKDISKATSRVLEPAEIEAIWPKLTAATQLIDYDKVAFDGIEFEFFHGQLLAGNWQIKHRVYMNNPYTDNANEYSQLIDAMLALRR